MHHIYTTPAFVVHSIPQGEASKFLLLFTRDFGMIGATAQGIRLANSKLRYHIQDGGYSNISIVRGKEVWRVTGAHSLSDSKANIMHLRILKLLKRLLHGEEKNEDLFNIINEIYNSDIETSDFENVECLSVLRILNTLGYIRNTEQIKALLQDNKISRDFLDSISNNKADIVKIINNALLESHL